MKTATTSRLPRISAITIFNIVVLLVLAVLISNKVSHENTSQVESAIRSSHRLIKAAAGKRELVKDQRVTTTLTKFE
ncbi:MAG TPA: hypothetical protein VGI23_08700 [Steroidobacteraceae bacterium]|jgi:hypothetical protein